MVLLSGFYGLRQHQCLYILINFFTAGLSETNVIKAHLIESVPYFRFLLMGIGLLLIMRYRPRGILPEKIEIK